MTRSALFDDQAGEQRRSALRIMQQPSLRTVLRRAAGKISPEARRFLAEVVGGLSLAAIVFLMVSGPIKDAEANRKYKEAQAEARMMARLFTKYDKAMIAEGERMTFPIAAYPQDEPKK